MKVVMKKIVRRAKGVASTVVEVAKVFSAMLIVFLILVVTGPVTYAFQHAERLL